jgi:CDP-6-deoxy-D-xylo-4-hexulose-3-dehydrase
MNRFGQKKNRPTLEFGDIVLIQNPDQDLKTNDLALIYEANNKEASIFSITRTSPKHNPYAIRIKKEDTIDHDLPTTFYVLTNTMRSVDVQSVSKKVGRLSTRKIDEILRSMFHKLVEKHHQYVHKKDTDFIPGKTYIRYAGRFYDADEMKNLTDASLDFWLTAGRFAKQFEQEFAQFLNAKYCLLTNSGSSANLLAVSALTSPKLGKQSLRPGDEVITTACAFPTTVNPILQNNLVPVFIDVDIGTYNIIVDHIESALSERTKAIFLAHTLGNPFDLDSVMKIAQDRKLWVIEDNCDALGSKYHDAYTGTVGHIGTFSFYPPHHITTGEGGALVTNDLQLKRLIASFRDWGRDCWCESGHDNTCQKRFAWKLGTLPLGYDHKYIFSHIGYNLKATDMQAAVGVAQLKKLPQFIEARKRNWEILFEGLKAYKDFFVLPRVDKNTDPSWFGFLLTIREDAPFSKSDIVTHLEKHQIATRMLFAGNIIRQPSFTNVKYRAIGNLKNTDVIMNQAFWIGVYPGMTETMLEYMISTIAEFVKNHGG